MKTTRLVLAAFALTLLTNRATAQTSWQVESHQQYDLLYTQADSKNKKAYAKLLKKGMKSVRSFFQAPFRSGFEVYIHPDRQSLDRQWQKDWQMPDFKSECWMVASGVGVKLDLLSPKTWATTACEHSYADKRETQQLITHELVHVFHGQQNPSPDFSDVSGIDWFVEGLATYASGQCDAERMAEVKKALADGKIEMDLDRFWTGTWKYGLSGSMVMYLDKTFGRPKLLALLKFNRKSDLLGHLNISETDLLDGWEKYLQAYKVP